MILSIIFIVSGVVVAILLFAKTWEIEHRKSFFLLTLVSKGDHRFRVWSHHLTHQYSVLKEDLDFFFNKQLPLRTKNLLNKTETQMKEIYEKYLVSIRNSRLIKPKNEGISEFFKNVSEMEKEIAADLEENIEPPAPVSQKSKDKVK